LVLQFGRGIINGGDKMKWHVIKNQETEWDTHCGIAEKWDEWEE
jgi:hypothetical protein